MKKLIKGLLAVIGGIVLVLVLALALHPLWIGSAVKCGAEKIGPKFTGTPIALANCDINLYAGRVAFDGFELSNPEGCSDKTAVRVDKFNVEVDMGTVASDVIVIKDITLTGVYVSYVKATPEKYNFDVIADNANAATSKKGEPAPTVEEPPVEEQQDETKTSKGEGPKVIIEKLTLGDLTVSHLGFPIPVQGTIVLTNIGKDTWGVSWEGAWKAVMTQLQQKLGLAGDGLLELGNQGLDLGTAGVTNALNAVKAMDVEGAKAILKDTGKGLKGLGKDLKGLGKDLGKDLKGLFK